MPSWVSLNAFNFPSDQLKTKNSHNADKIIFSTNPSCDEDDDCGDEDDDNCEGDDDNCDGDCGN